MIINENLVKLNLEASSREDVLKKLTSIASENGKVNDENAYIEAILKREEEFSTAVGFGVAIPHGKSDSVNEPFFMFSTVDSIDWKSMDGNPVDLVFLIGVPANDAGSTHLKILAALSRKLMKEPFRDSLRNANSSKEIMDILETSELGL
ncbi:PTS system IIA component, Fru family [Dethiosulfatibacter aminovorans DSM 17477]|uniref:PTS system IIA component, Fru family n=1 Tax=Dethiosulfatibacter aminovorans DSM 17477 TaxID=1121476 RepID=A0A1M6L2S7_9FIRM|nr:fructose PTS transporter subunit IIA [Dethiosulfatibacter aminovorans]SHJ65535.1 PTS system IIA component, Fru family [Dethiosulfatibacter aminovorans DSM 17477]